MAAAAAAAARPHVLHGGLRRTALASRLSGELEHELIQETAHVRVEVRVPPHLKGLTVAQVPDRLGNLIRLRHLGTEHEHGNDGNGPRERRLHLDADEVVFVSQPLVAGCVDRCQPARTDHNEDDIAPGDRAGDLLSKVCAGGDRVDVGEDGRRTERCREAISDAANQIARVVTAVRQKHLHGFLRKHLRPDEREPTSRLNWIEDLRRLEIPDSPATHGTGHGRWWSSAGGPVVPSRTGRAACSLARAADDEDRFDRTAKSSRLPVRARAGRARGTCSSDRRRGA